MSPRAPGHHRGLLDLQAGTLTKSWGATLYRGLLRNPAPVAVRMAHRATLGLYYLLGKCWRNPGSGDDPQAPNLVRPGLSFPEDYLGLWYPAKE